MATHQLNQWARCNVCNVPVCLVPNCVVPGHGGAHIPDPAVIGTPDDPGSTCSDKCFQYSADLIELSPN